MNATCMMQLGRFAGANSNSRRTGASKEPQGNKTRDSKSKENERKPMKVTKVLQAVVGNVFSLLEQKKEAEQGKERGKEESGAKTSCGNHSKLKPFHSRGTNRAVSAVRVFKMRATFSNSDRSRTTSSWFVKSLSQKPAKEVHRAKTKDCMVVMRDAVVEMYPILLRQKCNRLR